MADNIQAAPRNYFGGLLSDAYGWMQSPERTQQMQGLAGLIGTTGLPKTIERMSYGEPLTNVNQANVPLLKPETADALMTVAPMVGPALRGAGRLAGNAVNEAMVYGRGPLASITPQPMRMVDETAGLLTPKPLFNVARRDASDIFGAGAERVMYKDPKSGGMMEVLAKPDGTASVLSLEVPEKFRGKGIGESLQSQVMQDFPEMTGQVSSKAAAKTAYRLGRRPPNEPNATLDDVYKLMDENSSVNLVSPKMQKRFMPEQPSFTYPQEKAMLLAQQRAALPVEQGGLGLLSRNTPAERQAAMFPDDVYHATKAEFTSINPSATGKMGNGVYTSFEPPYAERYASGEGAQTMPLVTSGRMAAPELKSDVSEIVRQQMIKENPDFNMREWKQRSNQALADQGYSGLDVDKERLIFNPDDVRSRFAAFDPFRKTAATAAAMGVAAPDLLAQEQPVITQQQIDDEMMKYGLLGR